MNLDLRHAEARLHHAGKPGNHHIALRRAATQHPHLVGRQSRLLEAALGRLHAHVAGRKQRVVIPVDCVVPRDDAVGVEDTSLQPALLAVDQSEDVLHFLVVDRRPRQERASARDVDAQAGVPFLFCR